MNGYVCVLTQSKAKAIKILKKYRYQYEDGGVNGLQQKFILPALKVAEIAHRLGVEGVFVSEFNNTPDKP